jgi:hypothetical protein
MPTEIGLEFHIPLGKHAPMSITSTISQVYLARTALRPTDDGHDSLRQSNQGL